MKVIALSGYKGSGKDTIADHLVSTKNYYKVSFASTLKDSAAEQYNIPRYHFEHRELKERAIERYPVVSKDHFTDEVHHLLEAEFRHVEAVDGSTAPNSLYWTPRALTILEAAAKRSVNPNYWTNKVINNIHRYNKLSYLFGVSFVISDLRYKAQINRLKEEFGNDLITVRINRFHTINTNSPSERDLDDYKDFDVNLDVYNLSVDEVKKLVDNIKEF